MQEETCEEGKAIVLQAIQELEDQFVAATEYAKQLECQNLQFRQVAEDAKAMALLHSEENAKLRSLLADHQAMWEKSFNYASRCEWLEQQMKETVGKCEAERKHYEDFIKKVDVQLAESKAALQRSIECERQNSKKAEELLASKEVEHRVATERMNSKVEHLQRDIAALRKEAESREREWSARANEHTSTFAARCQELEQLKGELQEEKRLHDQHLQSVQANYEESLLQMAKRVNHGGGGGGTQDEYWRRKLMAQKQEYENKLETAKKQIEVLQKKEEERQQPTPRASAGAGRGSKRRKTNQQYQLEVQ